MRSDKSVILVGGPDIDARIPLMKHLSDEFRVSAAGSSIALKTQFVACGFNYFTYPFQRGTNPIGDIRTLWSLIHLFRVQHPTIVHAFDTKPCVYARLAGWLAGVPIVVGTIPGLGSLYSSESRKHKVIRWLYERLQQLSCTLSDCTIFQNHNDKEQFCRTGIAQETKTLVIPGSGIETNVFDPLLFSPKMRLSVRGEIGLSADAIVVIMVARLIRSKGVTIFAEVARMLRKQNPPVQFLLVGPRDETAIDGLNDREIAELQQDVLWVGKRNDITSLLAASDIMLFPTKYREGIPRVLLEAASMELPIITTDSPGCNEIVVDGMNGILLQDVSSDAIAHALETLITDPQKRSMYGIFSREHVREHFDIEIVAQDIKNCYLQLLDRANNRQKP